MKFSPPDLRTSRGSVLGSAVAGSLLVALLAMPSFAQEGEEEVFTLSPFSVTATDEGGYSAAESITGSRIRTRIAELPYAVNVVTNEFLEDFAADSLDDQFAYVSSFAGDEVEGWYQLRGFKQQTQLRNGFTRLGLIDRVTVSRAEVIKGPAAGSYGKINPGGIINIVTKSPSSTPQQEYSVEVGTDDYTRLALATTGPITKDEKLLYRLDSAWLTRDDWGFTGREQFAVSGVLEYNLSENTQFTLEKEYLERAQSRGRSLLPIRDSGGSRDYLRLATELYNYSFLGPDEINDRDIDTTDFRFSHKFSETFSMRAAYNNYDRYFDQFTGYPGEIAIDVDGRDPSEITAEVVMEEGVVRFVEPVNYEIWESGDSFQVDFLKEFNTERIQNRLLVTFDKNEQRDIRVRSRLNRNTTAEQQAMLEERFGIDITNKDLRRNSFFNAMQDRRFDVSNPDYSWIDQQSRDLVRETDTFGIVGDNTDPVGIGVIDTNSDRTVDVEGVFIANQMKALDGDLNINMGVRYDEVTTDLYNAPFSLSSSAQSAPSTTSESVSEETYQFGINYKLAEGLMVYGNTSTSFLPSRDFNTVDPVTGEPLAEAQIFENEKGDGMEIGFKGDGFGDKLSFTLAYFDIKREDVVINVSAPDPNNPGETFTYKAQNGLEQATGYEFDFNFQASRALSITGGIGFVDSEIAITDNAVLEGLPVAEIPDYSANIVMKYSIREGKAKGLFYTFGIRDTGESRYSNSGGRETIIQDGYTLFEGGVGYNWGQDRKHTLQLTAKNIFDEEYTRASAKRGDPQRFIFRYRVKM
ncbi:TonB-dependent receptor [Pelagicoccus sp. NFK12]|uniref:TonB-dependent receptor n=1 Tax=Pelagicoccus enzymogenes TaxID=2773457 RepID=A0A927IJP6_9BACT|nr:TonB-dependent receptor [Pelagicoccus enzymogenes]MBD5782023.1 TonB-dependent receptor [Pelagicoccus enzymogenes]